ncbi:MAG: DUF4439 domain-containing protein [Nocardioides sp.]
MIGTIAIAAVHAAAGCTRSRPDPTGPDPTSPAGQVTTRPDPALRRAIDLVTEQYELIEATIAGVPRIRGRLTALAGTSGAHQRFLADLSEPGEAAGTRTGADPAASSAHSGTRETLSRADAVQAVQRSIDDYRPALAELVLVARDGSLARALASMLAGTAQAVRIAALSWPPKPQYPPGAPEGDIGASERSALRRTLEGEHAALWWHGLIGSRTSISRQRELYESIARAYATHRARRDQLVVLFDRLGEPPPAAQPAYPLTSKLATGLSSRGELTAAAAEVAHGCARTYAWLIAQAPPGVEALPGSRWWALSALEEISLRELALQGTPENFPGASELANP